MVRRLLFVVASVVAIAVARPVAQPGALFTFHSTPWLNLHLYARAVARGMPPPTVARPYAQRDVLESSRMTAVASISTCAPRSINPATTTTDMAGKCRPMISR